MRNNVFVLELRESREKKLIKPEHVTFYYAERMAGFSISVDKAMHFETHQEAYDFIRRHGLFSFDVVMIKYKDKKP